MERRAFLRYAALLALGGAGVVRAESVYHRLQNPAAPTLLEKKHVPGVEVPSRVRSGEWFEVRVRVGYLVPHPSTPGHWITWIELRGDGKPLARMEFPRGGVADPVAVFRIRLEKTTTLEAVENCNLHGTWISEPVRVEVV